MNGRPEVRPARVAVVTPVFNDLPHTLRFLESLRKQTFEDFTTVLVDMGTDDTRKVVVQAYPEAVILKEDDVLWSGGTNAGVRYAMGHGYEYVFTVNNDVTLDEKCLENLVAFADAHPRSLVGSMVYYDDDPDRVWYFGGYLARSGNMPHAQGRIQDFTEPGRPEWLTGMGALIPVQAYRGVGLYDAEHFPQYFADADFSLRARRQGGYDLWVIPTARLGMDIRSSWLGRRMRRPRLRHLSELLMDRKSPMNLRARYFFYRKHMRHHRLKFIVYNLIYIPRVLLSFARAFALAPFCRRRFPS
jgi:GT2 family glycosyltransferase